MSKRTKQKRKNVSGKGRVPNMTKEDMATLGKYAIMSANMEPMPEGDIVKLMTPIWASANSIKYGTMGLLDYVNFLGAAMKLSHLTHILALNGSEEVRIRYLEPHRLAQEAANCMTVVGERQRDTGKFVATGNEQKTMARMVADLHTVMSEAPIGYILQAMRKATEETRAIARKSGIIIHSTKGHTL